jgi:hypothetical protein
MKPLQVQESNLKGESKEKLSRLKKIIIIILLQQRKMPPVKRERERERNFLSSFNLINFFNYSPLKLYLE